MPGAAKNLGFLLVVACLAGCGDDDPGASAADVTAKIWPVLESQMQLEAEMTGYSDRFEAWKKDIKGDLTKELARGAPFDSRQTGSEFFLVWRMKWSARMYLGASGLPIPDSALQKMAKTSDMPEAFEALRTELTRLGLGAVIPTDSLKSVQPAPTTVEKARTQMALLLAGTYIEELREQQLRLRRDGTATLTTKEGEEHLGKWRYSGTDIILDFGTSDHSSRLTIRKHKPSFLDGFKGGRLHISYRRLSRADD